jgi:hypothetical protein
MSSFSLFRKKMESEEQCRLKFEQRFITEGASASQIHIVRLNEDRSAYIVMSDAEGPDSAIVFTAKQSDKMYNLSKADYYIWEDKMYFVYEDVHLGYDASYIKQKAYQCNVKFMCGDEELGGYFISSLRTYVDTEFQNRLNISDKEQPVLVMPMHEGIEVGTQLSIGNKPWKVIDFDAITNSGILYISLERDFYKKSDNIIENYNPYLLKSGIDYSFDTEDAYFNTSSPLNIKARTEHKVTFQIPYGINSVEISVKQSGEIKTIVYQVEA